MVDNQNRGYYIYAQGITTVKNIFPDLHNNINRQNTKFEFQIEVAILPPQKNHTLFW